MLTLQVADEDKGSFVNTIELFNLCIILLINLFSVL